VDCFSPGGEETRNQSKTLLSSNIALNFTQPLFRNFKIDDVRQQLAISRTDRESSDVQLTSTIILVVLLAETARFNLHIDCLRGRNTHHILEGTFKATARALRQAVDRDARITGVLSTKGVL